MPHITIEYTENIQTEINRSELLKTVNKSLLSHEGLFSPLGIRSRMHMVTDYLIGDTINNRAFVHVTMQIASGRTDETKKKVGNHLLQSIDDYFEESAYKKQMTISLECSELGAGGGFYLQN